MTDYDVIIIGAGAAGLMCAATAGQHGRRVLLLDHAQKIGEKIRISGGGRCNFTNIYAAPDAYLSQNPHFCKSALKQYTQYDFIDLVKSYGIVYHEKKLGQLFCDESAQHIIDMLLDECKKAEVRLDRDVSVEKVSRQEGGAYRLVTSAGEYTASSVVVATGGLSIPKIGATKFAYSIAEEFGLKMIPPRAGLVPLTFQNELLDFCKELSGISVDANVSYGRTSFREGLLFTHRGLSGPSILQISSYWQEGEDISINLLPDLDVKTYLKDQRQHNPKMNVPKAIEDLLPARLAQKICEELQITGKLGEISDKNISRMAARLNDWRVKPSGTEGYRTAEVTLGGVDTDELSSKTMEVKKYPGLFFIGEAVDVTGHLGGYNFQWAWSSGVVAGRNA
jgi:predicted Rossmann fold flavoprotein